MKFKRVFDFLFVSVALWEVVSRSPVEGRLLPLSKPQPDAAAAFARWLVSQSSWGVLRSLSLYIYIYICMYVALMLIDVDQVFD